MKYGSNTYLHTDVIGNISNYPSVWLDALIGGAVLNFTPLLVGENGENYSDISADTNIWKLTHKMVHVFTWIMRPAGNSYFIDGSSFINTDNDFYYVLGNQVDIGNQLVGSNTLNAVAVLNSANVDATIVGLVNYKAYNNNLSPIANSKVVGGSAGVSDVYAGRDSAGGSKTASNLINKILIGSWSDHLPVSRNDRNIILTKKGSFESEVMGYDYITEYPTHDTINLYGSISPAVKTFSYLTNSSTRHKQAYVFKEMKYDATGVNQDGSPTNTWGDDSKFNIVDNVSTATDNNGNTVLLGQKARLLDYRARS